MRGDERDEGISVVEGENRKLATLTRTNNDIKKKKKKKKRKDYR